jgi:hypothetical protein
VAEPLGLGTRCPFVGGLGLGSVSFGSSRVGLISESDGPSGLRIHRKVAQVVSSEQVAAAPAPRAYDPCSVNTRDEVGDEGSYEAWITRTRASSKETTVLYRAQGSGLAMPKANKAEAARSHPP